MNTIAEAEFENLLHSFDVGLDAKVGAEVLERCLSRFLKLEFERAELNWRITSC